MSGKPIADPGLAPRAGRVATSLLVAFTAVLAIATPVLAKMPYFTVELDATAPVKGEPITVTVRLFADAQHALPTDWPDPALAGLIAITPADRVAGQPRSLAVRLKKIGPGTYVGQVVIDRPGRWSLRVFPDRSGWGTSELPPGYPSDIELEVRAPGPDLTIVPLMLGAILTAAGGLLVARRRIALDSQIRPAG